MTPDQAQGARGFDLTASRATLGQRDPHHHERP